MNIFITSTNTDVGKTYVTVNLYHFLKNEGYNVTIFKPFQTEEMPDGTYPDLEKYKAECGLSYETTSLYKFKDPISPHLAFKRETHQIFDRQVIIDRAEELAARHDIVLIEGAGGIAVPIHNSDKEWYMTADLIKDTGADHIISVVPSKLGAIGDIVVHQRFLESQNLPSNTLIMNRYSNTDVEQDNLLTVKDLLHQNVETFPENGAASEIPKSILDHLKGVKNDESSKA